MKNKNLKIKFIAIIIITISIIISFCTTNVNVNYYHQSLNQVMENSSPNITNEEKTIKIKYVDIDGNELLPEEELTKNIGSWYETERKEISCYRAYGDEPINKRGYMTQNSKDIVYVYQASKESYSIEQENNNVTIVYGDMKIADEYEIIVESYNLYNEKISGIQYELLNNKQTSLSNGITENGDLHLGVLTVREEGKKNYILKQVNVPNEYKQIVNGDVNITLNQTWDTSINKFVTSLEYDENIEGLKIEINNKKIIVKLQYKDNKYDLSIKQFVSEIDGIKQDENEIKTSLDDNGNIIYTKNEEIEKVENNQKIVFNIRVYNESENTATIKEIINEIPQGLEFLQNELNTENGWKLYKLNSLGDLEETDNINEAKYIKTSILNNTELKGFNKQNMQNPEFKEIKIAFKVKEDSLENGRIATNKVSLQNDVCDPNKENNQDECSVYVKKFDLKIEKNIVNVIVNNGEGQKTLERKENEDILKIDIARKEINNTKLNIKYEIKVTNVGEINGYVTEITDYLPEGFKLLELQDTQWIVDGKNVKTNDLEKYLLQPGESKSIFIECTYDVNETSIGSKINSIKITQYENESDSKDVTEDNEDKEEVIITVKTGFATICIGTILGILLISIIVTLILRRKNGK